MIKTCCQELRAIASHHYAKWPSHLSFLLPQKMKKKFRGGVIRKTDRGEWDNGGGHQGVSLASLAGISSEGQGLNAVSTIQNSQICSCWPSLHLHTAKSRWSAVCNVSLREHWQLSMLYWWAFILKSLMKNRSRDLRWCILVSVRFLYNTPNPIG